MFEENTNVEVVDDDLFFDPADFADEVDTGDHTEETETVEETAEETVSETTETATETVEQPTEQPAETKPEMFDLKFLGETKQYTRDEITTLAQKGLNHDRLLQQRDELQQFRTQNESMISDLGRIAQQFGMTPIDLLSSMETNLLRQQGKTNDTDQIGFGVGGTRRREAESFSLRRRAATGRDRASSVSPLPSVANLLAQLSLTKGV